MADILTKCRKCGRETKVSEYATAGAVMCPGCGTPLEFQSAAPNQARLQVRRMDRVERSDTLTGEVNERLTPQGEAISAAQRIATADIYEGVHKARQKIRMPLAIWNWIAFAALAGLLVGAQWYTTVIDPAYFEFYFWGRFAVWGLITLLILMVAFEDSTSQGLLCLFAPLYILYYAAVRVEYYWLRGLFMAVVVGLGAELYYLEDDAALAQAQVYVNEFIGGVGKGIERIGSESPEVVRQEPKRRAPREKPQREAPMNQPRNVPRQRPGRRF
jgi:hypothetical protein